jgi:hypothetical protein
VGYRADVSGKGRTTGLSRGEERELLTRLLTAVAPRPLNLGSTLDLETARIITADVYRLGETIQAALQEHRQVWTANSARAWLPAIHELLTYAQPFASWWRVTLRGDGRLGGELAGRFAREIAEVIRVRTDALTALSDALLALGGTLPTNGQHVS